MLQIERLAGSPQLLEGLSGAVAGALATHGFGWSVKCDRTSQIIRRDVHGNAVRADFRQVVSTIDVAVHTVNHEWKVDERTFGGARLEAGQCQKAQNNERRNRSLTGHFVLLREIIRRKQEPTRSGE